MQRFSWVLRRLQARRTIDSGLGLRPGSLKLLSERYIHATGVVFDYYDVLGVSPKATPEEIKKSFHELAKKLHPDISRNNPSAKRKFQEMREAYETLGHSDRREEYDKLRYQRSYYVNNDAERLRQPNFSHPILEGQTGQFESDIPVTIPPFTAQCQGSAHIVKESCRGSYVVEPTETVELVIPGGTTSQPHVPPTLKFLCRIYSVVRIRKGFYSAGSEKVYDQDEVCHLSE